VSDNARCTAIYLISLLISASAFAQNNRSAVSVNGNDANPCTTVLPCRSFGQAIGNTNPGGEVIALDSGGYGRFGISKSVSVIGAPGVHAALTATSGDGINVTAGSTDSVKIRGLNITLTTPVDSGINGVSCGTLSIENCSVNGGSEGSAISGGAGSYATVVDTVVRAAGGNAYVIFSRAALLRCRAEISEGTGLLVHDGTAADGSVSAVDFVSVGNGGNGALNICTTSAHNTLLTLDHALIANNALNGVGGADTAGSSTVRVTNSTVIDNGGFGFDQEGASATFNSMNNNLVEGNAGGDTHGAISLSTAH